MTNFQLKIIALITMTIDHIGMYLIPYTSSYYEPFRMVGRLSFVIFAFLITEGLSHTRNKERYIAVLFIFAFLIDIPRLFLGHEYFVNIFYTLGCGALAIYLTTHFKNIILQIVSVLSILYLATYLGVDYGAFGVMLILSISISNTITNKMRVIRELVMAGFYVLLMYSFNKPDIQMFGVYAFLIIATYNGKRGYYNQKIKYLVYVYYPLHIFILSKLAIMIYGAVPF